VSLDHSLADILKELPDCIATGWVDVRSGHLLEVETAGPPEDARDLVATATSDVFQGGSVAEIEQMFQRARGDATAGYDFREIIVMSQNLIHMFARCRTNEGQVLVVVTRISTNLGALITRTRAVLSALEAS
jgi:hypothetical protein